MPNTASPVNRRNRQKSGYSFPRAKTSKFPAAFGITLQAPFAKRYSNVADNLDETFGYRPPAPPWAQASPSSIPLAAPGIGALDTDRINTTVDPFRQVNAPPIPAQPATDPFRGVAEGPVNLGAPPLAGQVPTSAADRFRNLLASQPNAGPLPMIPPAGVDQELWDQQRQTQSIQAGNAAAADPFDRQGAQAGYARELSQLRDPVSFTRERQRAISAGYAASDAAGEAQRAQQTREGIGRMNDVMARLGMTPGSQKIAAITGEPVADYALNPETGRALKTFYEPSDKSPAAVAERKELRKQYTDRREKKEAVIRERRMFNAMAGTPAAQQARLEEAFDRTMKMERQKLLGDVLVEDLRTRGMVGAAGQSYRSSPGGLAAGAELFPGTGGAPPVPVSLVEKQNAIEDFQTSPLGSALGIAGIETPLASDLASGLYERMDKLSPKEWEQVRDYIQNMPQESLSLREQAMFDLIRRQGKATREEVDALVTRRQLDEAALVGDRMRGF